MRRIAIIEDDSAIRELIRVTVESAGFSAVPFCCAEDFLNACDCQNYSLILLDIMLPGMDGLDLLGRLQLLRVMAPVIFLTAKTSELDKVKGLNMGAYDYITKPFGVLELIARINAVMRRTNEQKKTVLIAGSLTLDEARRAVMVSDRLVELTNKEYELLNVLLANVGAALTRELLLEKVWGITTPIESRTLDMHIRTLRSKLGDAGAYIKTVRGVGYSLRAEEEE